jgi:hypothetical protein
MLLLRRSGRAFSTSSAARRVLCSLQELRDLQGKGIKFPMHPQEPEPAAEATRGAKPRRRRDLLATGFVFFNDKTKQPRAYINRYR